MTGIFFRVFVSVCSADGNDAQAVEETPALEEIAVSPSRSQDGSNEQYGADERGGAQVQALMRELNEQVYAMAAKVEHDESVLLICECVNSGCSTPLSVTRTGYERVRDSPMTFVVKPGHVLPEEERVVEETPDYVVVEKLR
jgi:hypothetical protein